MSELINEIFEKTQTLQRTASDPHKSVWVSANAGTGKTYVLVNRVLRLMLAGVLPEQILCLTFTKAAAGEMANRIFERLSSWVTMDDETLAETLDDLLGRAASSKEQDEARCLFAKALETPGGLKVQTIHGFCESLLKRFPLEANVPPHFTVLDEREAANLIERASGKVLNKAAKQLQNSESVEGQALNVIVPFVAETGFQSLLQDVIARRASWRHLAGDMEGAGEGQSFQEQLSAALNIPEAYRLDRTLARKQMADVLSGEELKLIELDFSQSDKTTDLARWQDIKQALKASTMDERIEAFANFFLTKSGGKRKSLATASIKKDMGTFYETLQMFQERFYDLKQIDLKLQIAVASHALFTLADQIITGYERLKNAKPALDFEDLIMKTAQLLSQRDSTQWVLYKLDQGIDHILVDEAQDTSPEQWEIFDSLVAEFFAGESTQKAAGRSIFAVGDEKQSIYSFQGAAPELFIARGQAFAQRAQSAGRPWADIPLNLSFRSTSQVLQLVDDVFADETAQQSLTSKEGDIRHYAKRDEMPGYVEVWPIIVREEQDEVDAFAPLEEGAQVRDERGQLATKIAKKIQEILASKLILTDRDRPVRPGDILILLQKRTKFAQPMIEALRRYRIPVAGADRIRLTGQIAVQDMMALARFLLMPEDDLSLAAVLKSPIFGLDDEHLLELCPKRKGSLWQSLRYFKERKDVYMPIYEVLSSWLSQADLLPPFEFLGKILDCDGVRTKLIARLGLEAGDALDEFLNLAILYDDLEPPSLQGFIHWVERGDLDIKRDMEQVADEVRIMTVHGAKGLESDIVFLPETCDAPSGGRAPSIFHLHDETKPPSDLGVLAWRLPNIDAVDVFEEAKAQLARKEEDERLRLLYVAMTRARDQLYIGGYHTKETIPKTAWYHWIEQALVGRFQTRLDEDGTQIYYYGTPLEERRKEEGEAISPSDSHVKTEVLPDWFYEKVKSEPNRTIPRAPSTLLPYAPPQDDEEDLKHFTSPLGLSPLDLADEQRFLRGRLTHALLEYLPLHDPKNHEAIATSFVAQRGHVLGARRQQQIVEETLAILRNPDFAPLFGQDSLAEVPITARLPSKKSGQQGVLLAGKIDRLAFVGDEIYVVDYKTNRPAPRLVEQVAESYLAQLAAYRLALQVIYPEKPIKSCLLWTDGPFMMEIAPDLLGPYEAALQSK